MFEPDINQTYYREINRRRSRLDICINLLRAVRAGVRKPTRIMYSIHISWNLLQKTLDSMLSAGFIKKIETKRNKRSTKHYELTQKGANVLHYLDKESDLLELMQQI